MEPSPTLWTACRTLFDSRQPPKRVWLVVNTLSGDVLTWSVKKAPASKAQRRLGFPFILAKLEPSH